MAQFHHSNQAQMLMRFGVLIILFSIYPRIEGSSLEVLSSTRQDQLKAVLWGGECWIIACSDVDDSGSGVALLESAVSGLKDNTCNGASVKCYSKLSSGKTIIQRLKLNSPPKGHPLLFVAANGEQPRALKVHEFAKIKESKETNTKKKSNTGGSTATPDAKVLTAFITKASLPVKPTTVTTNEGFKTKCLDQRHCLLLLTNSTASKAAGYRGSGDRATVGLAETLASKHRVSRVVLLDLGVADFSLSHALPPLSLWPKASGNGYQDFFAPRVLYVRKLSAKEATNLNQPKLPFPARLSTGGAYHEPAVSSCSPTKLLKAANQSAASVVFEEKKLSPRQWASLDRQAVNVEKLVFAIENRYHSWEAASHWLIGNSVFASPPSKNDMQALSIKYPLVKTPPPKWGARAFRPSGTAQSGFSSKSASEWLSSLLDLDLDSEKARPKTKSVEKVPPISLASIVAPPKFIPHKSTTKSYPAASVASPSSSPTKTQKSASSKKSPNTSHDNESNAAKRRRRLTEKAEMQERAKREAEARRKMDLEAEDFLPSSPSDSDHNGEELHFYNDDEDDDSSQEFDLDSDDMEEFEVGIDGSIVWDDHEEDTIFL